jgi:hypothetical protein
MQRILGTVIRVLRNKGQIQFADPATGILESIRFSRLDFNPPGTLEQIHEGQKCFFSIAKDANSGRRHASRISVDHSDCRWMDAEPN